MSSEKEKELMKKVLNAKQEKWFEQLEKCLSKIPKGVELAITNAGGGYADIILLEEGKAESMQDAQDDMHLVNFGSESLSRFVAKKITVNSENI